MLIEKLNKLLPLNIKIKLFSLLFLSVLTALIELVSIGSIPLFINHIVSDTLEVKLLAFNFENFLIFLPFENISIKFSFVIILVFLIKFISINSNDSSEKFYDLNAKFLEVGGLIVGNDVKMSGVKIGVVNQVYLDDDFLANVEFKVFSNSKIPKESVVSISSDGILGNKYLSVIPENRDSKEFLKQGGNFVNVIDFESIEDQVSKIIFLATQ